MRNMWQQLFPSKDSIMKFGQSQKSRSQIKKPVCSRTMSNEVGYHCFDCFSDRKAIICEQCFEASDHYGHRIVSQSQRQGCCDCGEIECLFPNKQLGCKDHAGQPNEELLNVDDLGEEFLSRINKCVSNWFHLIFTSAESYERSKNPANKEYSGKLLLMLIQVLEQTNFKNDLLLSKLITQILTSTSNGWHNMTHDCSDYRNITPVTSTILSLSSINLLPTTTDASGSKTCNEGSCNGSRVCTCSILDLLLRFMMSSFTIDEQKVTKDFLMKFMVQSSFKGAFTSSFTRNFLFLNSTPPNVALSNDMMPKLIAQIRNEIYGSPILCKQAYKTGAVGNLFEKLLQISSYFASQRHEFEPKTKQPLFQNYYHCYTQITQLLTKIDLFEEFMKQQELFDLLLTCTRSFDNILSFEQEIAMQSGQTSDVIIYQLYYRLTGQFNLFRIVANHLVTLSTTTVSQSSHQEYLLYCINKTMNELITMQTDSDKPSTYVTIARAFFYLFFAYFQFEIETVTRESLAVLVKALDIPFSKMQQVLLIALKKTLQPISIYHETANKMWVFNGIEFEKQITDYSKPDFELRVLDCVMVKVISRILPIVEQGATSTTTTTFDSFEEVTETHDSFQSTPLTSSAPFLLSLMPQNPFMSALLNLNLPAKIASFNSLSRTLQENANNMITKAFFTLADYLSFLCYNVCSSLDLMYFLCTSKVQSNAEFNESIHAMPANYFATIVNMLSSQTLDKKTLSLYYKNDIGKNAPAMDMLNLVCVDDQNVKVKPMYQKIYEPFNFSFNPETKCKYFAEVEVRKSSAEKSAMMLGNIRLSQESMVIAENTINRELINYLITFLRDEYCNSILQQNIKLKESLLFPVLKIAMIAAETIADKKNLKGEFDDTSLINQLLACVRNSISEEQFASYISFADERINSFLADKSVKIVEETATKVVGAEAAAATVTTNNSENNNSNESQAQQIAEAKKQQALQRQRELIAQMQAQSKKFLNQIKADSSQDDSQSTNAKEEEETCCFCKESLQGCTYGVLAVIQKNNLYLEMKKATLIQNLTSTNQLTRSEIDKIVEKHLKNLNIQSTMTISNTCDHKIHLKCLQNDQHATQLTANEKRYKDVEIKCKICNQQLNFFLEIKESTQMEEETLSRVVQKEQTNPQTSRNNNNSNNSNPTFGNQYDCGGAFDMYNFEEDNQDNNIPQFSNNNNNTSSAFGFTNGATSSSNFGGMSMLEEVGYKFSSGYDDDDDDQVAQTNSNDNDNNDDDDDDDNNEVIEEVIYKKVRLNEGTAQLIERQNFAFNRVRTVCSKHYENENYVESTHQQFDNELIRHGAQMNGELKRELETARSVLAKYRSDISVRPAAPALANLQSDPMVQFTFYETLAYNQVRYIDMAPAGNKSSDSASSTLIKTAKYLTQSMIHALAMLPASELKFEMLKSREEFCSKFTSLIQSFEAQQYGVKKTTSNQIDLLNPGQSFRNTFGTNSGTTTTTTTAISEIEREGYGFQLNESDIMQNNLADSYLRFLMVSVNIFGKDLMQVIQESLPQCVQVLLKQIELACQSVLRIYDPAEEKYWTSVYMVPLLKRVVLFAIISMQSFSQQSSSNSKVIINELEKLFMGSSQIEDELAAEDWVGKVLERFTGKSFDSHLTTCFGSDMIGTAESALRLQMCYISGESIEEVKKRVGLVTFYSYPCMLPLLLMASAKQMRFKLIDMGVNYMEYSKSNYKKKCSLCKRIPVENDLVQCLTCGDLICSRSCLTQRFPQVASSLNRHANIVHGGQALFMDTQSVIVFAVSNTQNTVLLNGSLYLNHLKQPFCKTNRCDWTSFMLETNVFESYRKALYELNVRNIIYQDQMNRQEKQFPNIESNLF